MAWAAWQPGSPGNAKPCPGRLLFYGGSKIRGHTVHAGLSAVRLRAARCAAMIDAPDGPGFEIRVPRSADLQSAPAGGALPE